MLLVTKDERMATGSMQELVPLVHSMIANDGSVEAMRRYVDVDQYYQWWRNMAWRIINNNEHKECQVGCDSFSSCVIQGEKRRRTSALTTN